MTDWPAWHAEYDDPGSSLSRRLRVVRQRVAETLEADTQVRRILSLCAGDGRDLIPALAALPVERRPEAVLVERDETLASAAREHAAGEGVAASVIAGDAGLTQTWRQATPVDLLMLCGVFGNVSAADVKRTIDGTRAMLSPGGRVLWTRGHQRGRDMRPVIRRWFRDAGFDEVAFDSEPVGFGVGVHRVTSATPAATLPDRLFSFVR